MTAATRASVLIVEDERIVALDLQQTLHEFGYDAFAIASSLDEAIALASARRPDLVLMDIRINGPKGGIETAQLLGERFLVPIVYLTAHADESTVARARLTEPHGYLVKPIKAAELRSTMEVALYRHALARELREREKWFSTTLRSIADAVLTVDLAGRVTFMNAVAERLTGASASAALGQPAQSVLRLLPRADSAAPPPDPLETALRERKPGNDDDLRLLNLETGVVRTISNASAPVLDGERCLGAVMVFRDTTEKQRREAELEAADRLTSLGTMAAGVAHEVNHPLVVIVSNAAFVAEQLAKSRHELAGAAALGRDTALRLQEIAESLTDLEPGRGTTFRVTLDPASTTTSDTTSEPTPGSTPAKLVRRARILAVDDEEMVLRVLKRVLHEHELVCVPSAVQALELLEAGQTFDAIISDVMMPGMTGMEFYQALGARFPELLRRLVFMSGGALTASSADFLLGTPNPQVDKPFASEDLLRALKLVL